MSFLGDEIDGIRYFDVENQRSLQELDTVNIKPSSDFILSAADFERGVNYLSSLTNLDEKQRSYLAEIIAAAKHQNYHADLRKFSEFFYDRQWTLFDYLPKHTPIFIDDFQKINEMDHKITQETAEFMLSKNCSVVLLMACTI